MHSPYYVKRELYSITILNGGVFQLYGWTRHSRAHVCAFESLMPSSIHLAVNSLTNCITLDHFSIGMVTKKTYSIWHSTFGQLPCYYFAVVAFISNTLASSQGETTPLMWSQWNQRIIAEVLVYVTDCLGIKLCTCADRGLNN